MARVIDPASRRARWAIGGLFFLNGFAFATWVSRIPGVQQSLALSAATLGAALAGLGAGSFVAMPISGWLIARAGSRPVVSIATIACITAVCLPGFAWSAVSLGAALAIFGAAMGAMDVAMNAQAVELEHRVDRPIMSTFHALWSLGGVSGAAIGGALAARGLAVPLHFGAVVVVLGLASTAILPALLTIAPPAPDAPGGRLRVSRALVGLALLAWCFMIAEGAMADWTPVYLSSVLGAGPGVAAAGYAVFSAAMTAGRLGGDRLTARFGRVPLVRVGSLLAAAGVTLALAVGTVPAALVGFVCAGAGFSVLVPLVFSAAGRLDSRSAGPGLAAVTTAGYLGFLAGPPVIGFIAEQHTLPVALGVVVVLVLVGALLSGAVAITDTGRGAPVPDR
jgi:MFS family permease